MTVINEEDFYKKISELETNIHLSNNRIRLNTENCMTGFFLFSKANSIYLILSHENPAFRLTTIPLVKGLDIKNHSINKKNFMHKYNIGIYCKDRENKLIIWSFGVLP